MPDAANRRLVLAVVAVALGTFLATFDGAAVEMVLPALRHDLRQPIASVQWLMTAYLLVGTAALLPAGRMGDLVGRARPWLAGVVVFVVGSAGAALAPGFVTLVIARVVQGLESAFVAANAAPLVVEIHV